MDVLITFLQNIFGSFFDAFEYLASKLLNDLPVIFGLSMGNWVLLFMATSIILGDFLQ